MSGLDIETKETKLLFRYAGLGSTNQPLTSINGLKRVSIGFSLNKGFSNSGLMPLINGQLKVSWNLALRGRMSNYSTKAGTVQLYGWGMKFVPGSKNTPSKWKLLFDLGNFNSFRQFKSILLREKRYLTDYQVCLLAGILIGVWPFSPNGNFFNNWLAIVYILPLGFYLQSIYSKK